MIAAMLIISEVIIVAAVLFLLIKLVKERQYLILGILMPAILASTVSIFYSVDAIKSLPLDGGPTNKFVFLDYIVKDGSIYLWAVELDKIHPSTYKFPYSEKLHKKMQQAKEQRATGVPVVGEKSDAKGGALKGSESADKNSPLDYNFSVWRMPEKDPTN